MLGRCQYVLKVQVQVHLVMGSLRSLTNANDMIVEAVFYLGLSGLPTPKST